MLADRRVQQLQGRGSVEARQAVLAAGKAHLARCVGEWKAGGGEDELQGLTG